VTINKKDKAAILLATLIKFVIKKYVDFFVVSLNLNQGIKIPSCF